jgi:glycine cleavage system H protein
LIRKDMNYPEDLKYSSEHEWVAVEGSRARVGITDFAQDALGDVVFVNLPSAGTSVAAATTCAEVESTKSVSDIYAPVSGEVVDVNASLEDEPEKINADPYGDGWIFVIEMSDSSELDALMDADAYRQMVE